MARRLKDLEKDLKRLVNSAAREAAVDIMNELGERGPVWRGTFRNSWVAVPQAPSVGVVSGTFPYSTRNVAFLNTRPAFRSPNKYSIQNETGYAEQALDLEFGLFFRPNDDPPIKSLLGPGTPRPKEDKIQVPNPRAGAAGNWTAPPRWYEDFAANSMGTYIGSGVRRAFEQVERRP